jgi:streptogramin lyase
VQVGLFQEADVDASSDEAFIGNSEVFPVVAGVNTFQLRVSASGGASFTDWGQLTAIYSPFGSTGGATLGTSAQPAIAKQPN